MSETVTADNFGPAIFVTPVDCLLEGDALTPALSLEIAQKKGLDVERPFVFGQAVSFCYFQNCPSTHPNAKTVQDFNGAVIGWLLNPPWPIPVVA